MWSNLVVSISHNYKVLSVEVEAASFDVSANSLDDGISLSFAKWKPKQSCLLKVYSEGLVDHMSHSQPEFRSEFEPFTQGDLIVLDYHEECPEESMLRLLPFGMYVVLKWVGIVFYGMIALACFIQICTNWLKLILRRRWDRIYAHTVQEILASQSTPNEGGWDVDLLEKDFWIKNHIPKPPAKSSYIVKGHINRGQVIGEHIVYGFIMLMAAIAFMSLIYVH